MSQEYPELIFVQGPQAGQRLVLSQAVLILGRGAGADVMLSEDFASRQQARYERIAEGPTLENLSRRGTWINGKRYKKGKRLLLETGDLIGVGRDTEILFAAAGEDPDAALAAYEASAATGRNAFGKKPKPQPEAAVPVAVEEQVAPPAPPESEKSARDKKRRRKRASEMTAGERIVAEEGARRRKIYIALGIYFAVILFVGICLSLYRRKGGSTEPGMPPVLRPQQIEDALSRIPAKSPNRLLMEERLEDALGLYQQYGIESVHLYRCVRAFQEALAYSGEDYFEKTENERIYRKCLKRLTERMAEKYKNAYLFEKANDWSRAEPAFRELLAILAGDADFEKNPLFVNVSAHHKRVQYELRQQKPSGRGRWF